MTLLPFSELRNVGYVIMCLAWRMRHLPRSLSDGLILHNLYVYICIYNSVPYLIRTYRPLYFK
jgi:hypothetical protein